MNDDLADGFSLVLRQFPKEIRPESGSLEYAISAAIFAGGVLEGCKWMKTKNPTPEEMLLGINTFLNKTRLARSETDPGAESS